MLNRIKRLFVSEKVDSFSRYMKIDGWLTPAEARGLSEVAALVNNGTVLEIGSWKGKSTWCIAHGLKTGTIHCIDPFNAAGEEGSKEIYEQKKGRESLFEQFQNNLRKVPAGVNIIPHKGYSNEFVGTVTNIDFLFIDGDHSIEGCKFDFENFEKDVRSGGYIASHDYDPERENLGPTWVINHLLKSNSHYTPYNNFDTLCVYQKK